MHRPRVLSLLAALLFVSALAFPTASFAQTTADIVGRVTDTSGAVLPGATVTLENVGTRDLRTTVTSDTGDYLFTLLPIGTYTVKIEMQGFQTHNARVALTSGDRTRIDGKLSVGSVSESVWSPASRHCCKPTPRRSVPSSASRRSRICRSTGAISCGSCN